MNDGMQPIEIIKAAGGSGVMAARDAAAVEEPLEIRLHGAPFVVIMRTPGSDRELAAGFLLAEQVIRSADDLGTIEHCRDVAPHEAGNVVNVTLVGKAADALEQLLADRRLTTANSSCGVCGRRSIDDLMKKVAQVESDLVLARQMIVTLPSRLRESQRVFDETGGLHAAALFDRHGKLVLAAEDVGRHNAVDKIIGNQLLLERLPLADRVLFVSGRTSFEIVQKAVVAGVPVVGSVSAPSSLAIDLARRAGLTLIGFVRDDSFNIYAGAERLDVS
jgi:FdhD protein